MHQRHREADYIKQRQSHAAERRRPARPSGVAAAVEGPAPVPEGAQEDGADGGLQELDVVHQEQDERGSQQEHGGVQRPAAAPAQPAGDEQQPDADGQE